MLKVIRGFCRRAKCEPKDLRIEWTPASCPKVVALNPQGKRIELLIFASIDQIAQVIHLCATGQEHRYPELQQRQAAIDAHLRALEDNGQLETNIWQNRARFQGEPAITDPPPSPSPEEKQIDWRTLKTVEKIVDAFPTHPSADDLIDLYQVNKQFNNLALIKLLQKHSR